MKCFYQYLVYDQHGKYGAGGYSRNAKHKPLPRVVEGCCDVKTEANDDGRQVLFHPVVLDGVRKRKFNAILENGVTYTLDYPDIVPAWWRDNLAVATKFSEATTNPIN